MVNVKKNSKIILLNLLLILFFWLIAGNFNVNAQQLNEKTTFTPDEINEFIIKEFSGTETNNKIYFRFLVLDNQNNAEYILESSFDGTNFIEGEKKYGFKSPNKEPLLYCYSINQENAISRKYRIKMVSESGINYTEEINVKTLNNSIFAASNN